MSQAQEVQWADLAAGDRVLVRGHRVGEVVLAESIVLMSAREITRRNDNEKREWMTRGVAGVVEKVNAAGEITLLVRGGEGMKPVTVQAAEASFLRYARDSVRFADAGTSRLEEVKKGDQMRVLGDRTADGGRVKAEEILFGTFRSVAGTITSLDAEKGIVEMKDAVNGKPVVVRTKADSQIKRMPAMGGGPGGPGGPRGPGGPGMLPDINMMLERIPVSSLSELRSGETIIASATVGEHPGELTAILILGNAEGLLARLSSSGASTPRGTGMGQGMIAGGGLGGLDTMMGMPNMQ